MALEAKTPCLKRDIVICPTLHKVNITEEPYTENLHDDYMGDIKIKKGGLKNVYTTKIYNYF